MSCNRSNRFLLVTLLLAPSWCHAYHPKDEKRFRRLQDKNNDKNDGKNGETSAPTILPSSFPSSPPSDFPKNKKNKETSAPSILPSSLPSELPTSFPTFVPTDSPSVGPSALPVSFPTTDSPSVGPSALLVSIPTSIPTTSPSIDPTLLPSEEPSLPPEVTESPTFEPPPDRDVTPTPVVMETPAPSASPIETVSIPLLDFHLSVKTAVRSEMTDFDVVMEEYLDRTMWFEELDSVSLVQSAMREEENTYVLAYWGRAIFIAPTTLEQQTVWDEQEAVLMDKSALQQSVDDAGLKVTIEKVELFDNPSDPTALETEPRDTSSATRRPVWIAALLMLIAIFAVLIAFVLRYRHYNKRRRAPPRSTRKQVQEGKDFDDDSMSNVQSTGGVVMRVPDAPMD